MKLQFPLLYFFSRQGNASKLPTILSPPWSWYACQNLDHYIQMRNQNGIKLIKSQELMLVCTYYFGSLILMLTNFAMSKTPFGFKSVYFDYIDDLPLVTMSLTYSRFCIVVCQIRSLGYNFEISTLKVVTYLSMSFYLPFLVSDQDIIRFLPYFAFSLYCLN